ncbi:MAG TPA: hypothetical protein PLM29_15305 [Deltaproteobacteria bacterium]|nr:hypothetical protein [Deltaproteobacteria bacterium]
MSGQYAFEEKSLVYVVYFSVLGIAALGAGMADLIVTISSSEYSTWILEIPHGGFRGGWGGLIMVFAGVFYLSGIIRDAHEIHQFAKVVLASVLIWVLAGTDILSMIAGSIPSPEADTWLNTKEGFVQSYAPPYTPAVLILPFSLVVTFYIHRYHKEKGISFGSPSCGKGKGA